MADRENRTEPGQGGDQDSDINQGESGGSDVIGGGAGGSGGGNDISGGGSDLGPDTGTGTGQPGGGGGEVY